MKKQRAENAGENKSGYRPIQLHIHLGRYMNIEIHTRRFVFDFPVL